MNLIDSINEFTPRQLGNIESAIREHYMGLGTDTSAVGFNVVSIWREDANVITASVEMVSSSSASVPSLYLLAQEEDAFFVIR